LSVVRQLGDVLSNVVVERELSLPLEEKHGHGCELLGDRCDIERAIGLQREVVLKVSEAVGACEQDLAGAKHADGASWNTRLRLRSEEAIELHFALADWVRPSAALVRGSRLGHECRHFAVGILHSSRCSARSADQSHKCEPSRSHLDLVTVRLPDRR
jgi:hypothetical protein